MPRCVSSWSSANVHASCCRFENQPVVQRLWDAVSAQLEDCSACVNAYHAIQVTRHASEVGIGSVCDVVEQHVPTRPRLACKLPCAICDNLTSACMQVRFLEAFSEESSRPLLEVMRRHDLERLSARLARTKGTRSSVGAAQMNARARSLRALNVKIRHGPH